MVFGLRPSSAILGAMILHHLDKYNCEHPNWLKKLKIGLYVDDLITDTDSVESAF